MFEYVVLGVVVANLFVTAYVAWRAPQVLSGPFIQALGQKEGELLLLRATVQAAQQEMARLRQVVDGAADAARERQPEKVAKAR